MQLVRNKREAVGLVVVGLLVIGWFFGLGDHTPSRQDAERFLAWLLEDADGIVGFHESGKVAQLTAGLVGKIDDVECHHDTSSKRWFQRFYHSSNYDCIYRLAGTDGSRYLTVITANYVSSNEFSSARVGNYGISYAGEPGQRAELAKYGITLPLTD